MSILQDLSRFLHENPDLTVLAVSSDRGLLQELKPVKCGLEYSYNNIVTDHINTIVYLDDTAVRRRNNYALREGIKTYKLCGRRFFPLDETTPELAQNPLLADATLEQLKDRLRDILQAQVDRIAEQRVQAAERLGEVNKALWEAREELAVLGL